MKKPVVVIGVSILLGVGLIGSTIEEEESNKSKAAPEDRQQTKQQSSRPAHGKALQAARVFRLAEKGQRIAFRIERQSTAAMTSSDPCAALGGIGADVRSYQRVVSKLEAIPLVHRPELQPHLDTAQKAEVLMDQALGMMRAEC